MKEMRLGLRSSGLLLEVVWYLFTNILGRCIGPTVQNQAIHVGGTNTFYRSVGNQLLI